MQSWAANKPVLELRLRFGCYMDMTKKRSRVAVVSREWLRIACITSACMVTVGAISGCGGGGEELCAASNQTFSIDFEESQYTLSAGAQSTISSKIFPESCRSHMTVDVRTGSIPTGMSIVDANLQGTPSEAGKFTVQLTITGVKGYQSQSFAASVAPRSREITVLVR